MSATTELAAEVALARAAAAARAGRLDEAAATLRELPDLDDRPAALDLLARVHAQCGEWDAADARWERLQELDPGHQDAAAGRRAIARIRAGERRARPLARPGVVGLGAVVVAVLVVAGLLVGPVLAGPRVAAPASPPLAASSPAAPGSPGAAPSGNAVASPAQAPPGSVGAAPSRAAGTGTSDGVAPVGPGLSTDRAGAVHALAQRLAMPGVRVTERPDHVDVVFDQALFTRSDRLSPAGARLLAAFGPRLTGGRAPIAVVGQTVAVPGGPASGGSVVALARALVAARELAAASGIPLTAFTLSSADQAHPFFPQPALNRTVSLSVLPG